MISLEPGNVTAGTEPDVNFIKTSDTSYRVDFVLPLVPVDTSDMIINASNILFNDGSNLQHKYDTGEITEKATSLPYTEIGTVSANGTGLDINEKVTVKGMSIVGYIIDDFEYKGIWFKYDNARLGFYLNDNGIGIYLDIGTVEE